VKIRKFLIFIALVMNLFFVTAQPFGASVTSGSPETAPADAAGTASAYAGNITELMINGFSTTQSWQGFYGNVTGTIQLADADDDVLYNWTLASPQGEVYASTNSSVSWGNIQCFNFTANGTMAGTGGETPGATSISGKNLTQLESNFNMSFDDVDGVNETFTLTNHDSFYTASLQFSADECISARVYGSTGQGVDQQWEEVLLYEPATTSVVFASLLEENMAGFDTNFHDFEMLVLENGHGTDAVVTTYNFFVEME